LVGTTFLFISCNSQRSPENKSEVQGAPSQMRLRHITRRTRSLIVAGWLLFMRGISKIAGYDSGGTGNRVAAMMMM
jgi:hypothetical protein